MRRKIFKLSTFTYILLIALKNITLSNCVSTCVSNIDVDGNMKLFHTEFYQNFASDLLSFCNKNYLNGKECDQIKIYHIEKCFPDKKVVETVKSDGLDHDEGIEVKSVNNNKKHIGKVDYSIKVGPIVNIYLLGQKYNLQSYSNETPDVTVRRVCIMLKLHDSHCNNIKDYFQNIWKEYQNQQREDSRSSNQPNDEESAGHLYLSSQTDSVDDENLHVESNNKIPSASSGSSSDLRSSQSKSSLKQIIIECMKNIWIWTLVFIIVALYIIKMI